MIENNTEMSLPVVTAGEVMNKKAGPEHPDRDIPDCFSDLVGELLSASFLPGSQLPEDGRPGQAEGSVFEETAGETMETVLTGLQGREKSNPQRTDQSADLLRWPVRPDDPGAEDTGVTADLRAERACGPQEPLISVGRETAGNKTGVKSFQGRAAEPDPDGVKALSGQTADLPDAGATAGTGAGNRDPAQIFEAGSGSESAGETFGEDGKDAPVAKNRPQRTRPAKADRTRPAARQGDGSFRMEFRAAAVANGQSGETEPGEDEDSPAGGRRNGSQSGAGERSGSPAAVAAKQMDPAGQVQPGIGRPAGHTPAPKGIEGEVIRQVAARIRLNKARIPSRASIRLEPASLGKLHVDLRADGHQVSIRMVAETHVVRDLLEANLSHLRSELQQQGMDLRHVEVFVGRDPGDGRQPETRRRPKGDRKFQVSGVEEPDEARPPAARTTGLFDRNKEVDTFA